MSQKCSFEIYVYHVHETQVKAFSVYIIYDVNAKAMYEIT